MMVNASRKRVKRSAYGVIGIVLLATSVLLPGRSNPQDDDRHGRLVVPGSGSSEEILKILAAAFHDAHPELEVVIPESTGTVGGINSAYTGKSPLARVGRPLEKEEIKLGLTYLPFARDAVVFVAGSRVEIKNLTAEQLGDIFQGRIVDWAEVGGSQGPVRVLTRQPTETSLKIIRKHLAPFKDMVFTDQAKCAFHDHEMVDLLNKFPTSIGFLTNASIRTPGNKMKAIGINGIAPTAENLRSGEYPLLAEYGLVYAGKELTPVAAKFVDFIFSHTGKQIIEDHGLVSMARR